MKVVIIGAGNLATNVSLGLQQKGIEILQVYSRTLNSASALAQMLDCNYVSKAEEIATDADLYLIAVSDKAIAELLPTINFNNKLIAHTAGSIPMNDLSAFSKNFGVFYPLQTFSKLKAIDFSTVPFCIEANTPENEQTLIKLATVLSTDVRPINSEQRKQLHLAAVFAGNFVNHLYAMAGEIIQQKELPFDLLYPLISEIASKIRTLSPREAQTGPAIRHDETIIEEHLAMLNNNPSLRNLYLSISESIIEYHQLQK